MSDFILEDISREIENTFTGIHLKISNESKQGITYKKKLAETGGLNLINHIYGYDFKTFEKSNEAVIDGEDLSKNTGIQVTVEREKGKYRDDTISKFPIEGREYITKVIFLTLVFLPSWRSTYESWTDLNCIYFDCKKDIYTLDRIHRDIVGDTDIDRVFSSVKLLNQIFKDFNPLVKYITERELENNNIDKIKDLSSRLRNINL